MTKHTAPGPSHALPHQTSVVEQREASSSHHGFYSTWIKEAPQSCISQLQSKKKKEQGTAFFERRPRIICKRPTNCAISAGDEKRWDLIKQALETYPILIKDRVALLHSTHGTECLHLAPEQLVADHIQNWPAGDLLRDVNGLVVGMVLWLANFCYGGIHAAAWNEHFPSSAERWLWRASTSYIGFCGGLWVVLNFVVARCPRLNDFWEHWMDGQDTFWQSFALGLVVSVCGFSLMLARVFIVVEAFMSIREMPAAAYQTPRWTNVFPHL